MRKLLFILVAIITLFGCKNNNQNQTVEQNPYTVNDDYENVIVEQSNHRLMRIPIRGYKFTTKFIYIHSVDCNCGEVSSIDSALYYMYNNYPNVNYTND